MVGLQIEGSWVLPLLRVDFWRKDGHSFPFSVPPEGESVEIKSQGLHWNGMCRTPVPGVS